jgi:putative Mg2+ transporter-C (MgtC) family protein
VTAQEVIPDITLGEIAARLAIAAGLSGAIGLERELRERTAGLRTHILVGVGAAVFTIVSAYGWSDFVFNRNLGTVFDPTRIAAQIVTGIGFLGAGAIIRQGVAVRGLTTAAALWVVAAIGMAAGAGFYSVAAIATGIVLVGLWPLRMVEPRARTRLRGHRRREVELEPGQGAAPVFALLDELDVNLAHVDLTGQRLHAEVDLPRGLEPGDVMVRLAALEGIGRVHWAQ